MKYIVCTVLLLIFQNIIIAGDGDAVTEVKKNESSPGCNYIDTNSLLGKSALFYKLKNISAYSLHEGILYIAGNNMNNRISFTTYDIEKDTVVQLPFLSSNKYYNSKVLAIYVWRTKDINELALLLKTNQLSDTSVDSSIISVIVCNVQKPFSADSPIITEQNIAKNNIAKKKNCLYHYGRIENGKFACKPGILNTVEMKINDIDSNGILDCSFIVTMLESKEMGESENQFKIIKRQWFGIQQTKNFTFSEISLIKDITKDSEKILNPFGLIK